MIKDEKKSLYPALFFVFTAILIYVLKLRTFTLLTPEILLYLSLIYLYLTIYRLCDKDSRSKYLLHIKKISPLIFIASLLLLLVSSYMSNSGVTHVSIYDVLVAITLTATGLFTFKLASPNQKPRSTEWLNKWKYVNKKTITLLLVSLIVLVGFTIRMNQAQKVYLRVDESISGLAAQGMIETLKPTMPSGFIYDRDPLTTIILAVTIKVLGFNGLGLRVGPIIFGTLTIVLAYYLGRTVGGTKEGITMALLVAVLNIEVSFSRWARMYQFLQYFFLLTVYLLAKVKNDQKLKYYLGATAAACLSFFSHRLGVVAIGLVLATLTFDSRKNIVPLIRSNLRNILILTGAVASLLIYFHQTTYSLFSKYVYGFGGAYDSSLIFSKIGNSYHLIIGEIGIVLFTISLLGGLLILRENKNKPITVSVIAGLLVIPLAVDILIFSQDIAYRTRYIYLIVPIFILGAAVVLGRILARYGNWGKITVTLVILNLFLSNHVVVQPDQIKLEGYQEALIQDQQIFRDLKEQLQGWNNGLLIANPPETATVYLRVPDFWLVSHPNEIRLYSTDDRYTYTNSEILSNLGDLKNLESRPLMIFVDKNRWTFIGKDIRDYIYSHYQLVSPQEAFFDVFISTPGNNSR